MSLRSLDRGSVRPPGELPTLLRRSSRFAIGMGGSVISMGLRTQEDVLLTRRRTRDLAGFLQLGPEEQSRLATAVWEVARLAHRYGSGSEVDLAVADDPPAAVVTVSRIPHVALTGVRPGEDVDRLDLAGLRQLVDRVEARDANGNTAVRLVSELDDTAWVPGVEELSHVLGSLQRHESGEADATVQELRMQNAELMSALSALGERERELTALNRELVDTNRGVTALLGELGQQADELRETAASNARFLRALTHELRTPLYAVRGITEAILRESGSELRPRLREDITLIGGAMEEALDLVNDHLDLAKLAAGRETVRLSVVHVEELFSALRGVALGLPRSPDVVLVFEPVDDVGPLRTDGFKLGQILRNFISNGLKFTPHGEIRVGAVEVVADDAVCFSVSDTGPGLAPDDQRRIFDEFVQLEAEHGALRGSGLGLSICRRLATLLGGEVGIASEPGRGTTFTATIPTVFATDRDDVEVVEELRD
jgi:signal transduction histidine kinase